MPFITILLIKATLILLLSALLTFLFRRHSASLRHWIISLAFLGILLLPFLLQQVPEWPVELPAAALLSTQPEPTAGSFEVNPGADKGAAQPEWKGYKNPVYKAPEGLPAEVVAAPKTVAWPVLLLGFWALGTSLFLFRFLRGLIYLMHLTRRARPFPAIPPSIELGGVPVLSAPGVATPMTWGVFRPVILLPPLAQAWPETSLEVVLAHEAGHVRRGDFALHVISELALALYWFHPLVWWLRGRQLLEREKACDEYVLRSGLARQTYAEQLVAVAGQLSLHQRHTYGLPMAKPSQIRQRVLAILRFQREKFRFSRHRQFLWASFYVGSVCLLAALTPVKPLAQAVLPDIDFSLNYQENIKNATLPATEIRPDRLPLIPEAELPLSERNVAILPEPGISRLPLRKPNLPALSIALPERRQADAARPLPTSRYLQWSSGKSTFKICTYGELRVDTRFPYVEAVSPEDMIVVEEVRKTFFGEKTYRLALTRAPYDGGLVQDFRAGEVNSWSGGFRAGEPLYLFTIDGEWDFLGRHQRKWMAEHMQAIQEKLALTMKGEGEDWIVFLSALSRSNPEEGLWGLTFDQMHPMIRRQRELQQQRFLPEEQLGQKDFKQWSLEEWNLPAEKDSLQTGAAIASPGPAERLDVAATARRKIGRTEAVKTYTGGNSLIVGQKFASVIRNVPTGAGLQDFNYHLGQMDFDKINFRLSLYDVNQPEQPRLIGPGPIDFTATGENDWISVDLKPYGLRAGGDILVVLELGEAKGRKEEGYLFFSHGKDSYQSYSKQSGKNWDFMEGNYAFYLTVE